jgi:hypothetical protein
MGGCYGWIGKTGFRETPTGESVHAGMDHFSTRNTDTHVTGSQNETSPISMRLVTAVTDQNAEENLSEDKGEDSEQRRCYVRGVQTFMVRGEI